jgi:outer membrane protein insertion porin family
MLIPRALLLAAPLAVAYGTAAADDEAPTDQPILLPPAPPPVVDAHTAPNSEPHRGSGVFVLGAGFSPDDHFIAHSAVIQPNLFGTGQRLALSADVSERQQRFALTHTLPELVRGFDLETELFSRRIVYPGFTREGVGGSIGLGTRVGDHTRIYGRYRVEHVAVSIAEPPVEATAKAIDASNLGNGIVATIGAGLEYSTLDDKFLPRRGTRFELFTDNASKGIGSDYSFTRTAAALDLARGLGPLTLRLHGRATYIHSTDPMGVPLSERLMHDGHGDIRGYSVASGAQLGDNLEAIGKVELELPVWKRAGLSLAAWADAGVTASADTMWGPTGDPLLRRSAGVSLIWRTPIGPLRFDVALPFDGPDNKPQFLFGLGGSF